MFIVQNDYIIHNKAATMISPIISIIVPVYNVEKYLPRCLDSIVTQTLRDIEIICVNDGTKDNSVSILNEYAAKDNRIKIIHKKNGGLSSARNEGMKYATAEYIGFVDSDDWIEPDTYELAYNAMIVNNVDLVCWYAQIEIENGLIYDDNELQNHRDYHKINNIGFFEVTDEVFHKCTVTAWNKLYKKSIIKKYNLSFPHGFLHEDVEFFFKYALVCQSVYFIDKYLIHYLQRSGSIMSDKVNNRNRLSIGRIKIMNRLYQYYINNYIILGKYKKTISKALIWDCFASECWVNSKKNQLYIYWYASKIVRKMDLTLLEDSNDFLYNLKHRNFSALFYFFNNITPKEAVFGRLRKTLIYRILRKLYHKTNHYKIKDMQRKYEDVIRKIDDTNKWLEETSNNLNNRIDETTNWLDNTNNRIDDTNKWLGETSNWLEEKSNKLEETSRKLDHKTLLINRMVKDKMDLSLNELSTIQDKSINAYDINKKLQSLQSQPDFLRLPENNTVINELKKLDDFIFCTNDGNLGDVIIAEAQYQLFSSLGLKYSILDLQSTNFDNQSQYSVCVYSGGGRFNGVYDYKKAMTVFESKYFKKIIILPHSFFNCEDLFKVLDERFIVFCREERSYNYCVSMNKKAKFILSHDMAFNIDYKLISSEPILIYKTSMSFNRQYSIRLYESYCYFMITSNKIKRAINEKVIILRNGLKLGLMLRIDVESNLSENEKDRYLASSVDLSAFGWISCSDAGLVKALSLLFIQSLNYFDTIITDRLHIGIAAALLGKKIYMLNNNYGKLSGVYKQSMRDFPNVKIYNDISEIEKEIEDSDFLEKTNKIDLSFNTEMTFQEFLAVYFSAYNPDNTVTKTFLNTVMEEYL